MQPCVTIPSWRELDVYPGARFTKVFKECLEHYLAHVSRPPTPAEEEYGKRSLPHSPASRVGAVDFLRADAFDWLEIVPDSKLNDFISAITDFAETTLKGYPKDDPDTLAARRSQMRAFETRRDSKLSERVKTSSSILVDKAASPDSLHAMKALPKTWVQLRDNILKRTKESGAKAQLARDVGVSRQAVNKWLNQGVEPSAEITLRLLAWVTAREAK